MRLRNTIAVLLIGLPQPLAAQTSELLSELTTSNPVVRAARQEADAARADLWAARGQALPQLSVTAQTGRIEETLRLQGLATEFSGTRDPLGAQAAIEQPLFTSGRLGGSISAAKAEADRAESLFDAVRQDITLEGATAIADVVRDRAILSERALNDALARDRLEETKARIGAGLATQTDLRQAEARAAQAAAELALAESALARAQAAFEQLFGFGAPAELSMPQFGNALPESLEDALARARTANPTLSASEEAARSARMLVRAERGRYLPQVSLNAAAAYVENERFGEALGEAEQYSVTINGRWDLFSGGSNLARTRAAKRRAAAADDRALDTDRRLREQTISAWNAVVSGQAVVAAREAQSTAAVIAAEGVAAEFRSGRRTRLDVLDADREKADAEVGLIAAERDLTVATFTLARLIGAL